MLAAMAMPPADQQQRSQKLRGVVAKPWLLGVSVLTLCSTVVTLPRGLVIPFA